MRKLAVLLAVIGLAVPAVAAKRVTVAELQQFFAAAHGQGDAELAQQLSGLELSERLSATTQARLKAELPGEKATQELDILADQSAFLALPASEISARPAPDAAAQRQIMAQVVNYVTKSIHQLPNLIATRATRSYADRPEGTFSYQPLHQVGETSTEVVYRDGREVDTTEKGQKPTAAVGGLTSWGEFGPILNTVLMDAAQNTLAWSHWEDGANGAAAVFRYAVPAKSSHYRVQFCCVTRVEALHYHFAGVNEGDSSGVYNELAGYHGEMTVDPESGAILRITVIADLGASAPLVSASMAVEYGPVEIGGKRYIGPVKSVAVAQRRDSSVTMGESVPIAISRAPIVTQLNNVTFEQYHIFRTDARVLSPEEAKALAKQGASPGPESASATQAPAATVGTTTEASTPTVEDSPAAAGVAPATASAGSPQPAPAPVATEAAPAASTSDNPVRTPVYRAAAHEVIVDVVVSKGNGDAVSGLGKQDFAIAEDGKPQAIDFFEEHTPNNAAANTPPAMPSMPRGAVTNVPPSAEGDAVNVLLIDTLNTEPQDQVYVHHEIEQFLKGVQPGTRVGIFALGSKLRFVQGFTADSAALLAALKRDALSPKKQGSDRSDAADEQAHVTNLQMMQASPFAIQALQAALADKGGFDMSARASMTFEALNYLGNYLAGVPGRKNLIWFASSFPVTIFPTAEQAKHLRENPEYFDKVMRTANLFTVSKIAVYPISAQGMMMEHVAEANTISPVPSPTGVGHIGSLAPDINMSPYSAGAAERAGTIYTMEELAASTGGKAFYNTNDLDGAMQRAINDGAHYYTIGYSPTNTKMDGEYRAIDVKVAGKYKLAYRRGYNAEDRSSAVGTGDPLGALLSHGLPPASGVLYGVLAAAQSSEPDLASGHAGENTALKGKMTRYGVDFTIRAQDLALDISPSGDRSGKVLIGLKAYDTNGNAVNWVGDEETVSLKAADYDALVKSGLRVHLEIDVPEKMEGSLVTAVYDWNSEKAGTLEIGLRGAGQ